MGDKSFYGPGMTIDTSKPFTVVTQFITNDGTTTGTLSEIKRFYVQNGKTYANSNSQVAGVTGNSITTSFCSAQKTTFGDQNLFATKGGLATMGAAMAKGMVLVMSIWDDHSAQMLWLDSTYPTTAAAGTPGAARGSCSTSSGAPTDVESASGSASVTYSNIKWGPLNSTFGAGSVTTPGNGGGSTTVPVSTPVSTPVSSPTSGAGASKYGQCGGIGWNGATSCAGSTCTVINAYYSQCL
jgi:cellulose 1,4-beta-cellobiosidase